MRACLRIAMYYIRKCGFPRMISNVFAACHVFNFCPTFGGGVISYHAFGPRDDSEFYHSHNHDFCPILNTPNVKVIVNIIREGVGEWVNLRDIPLLVDALVGSWNVDGSTLPLIVATVALLWLMSNRKCAMDSINAVHCAFSRDAREHEVWELDARPAVYFIILAGVSLSVLNYILCGYLNGWDLYLLVRSQWFGGTCTDVRVGLSRHHGHLSMICVRRMEVPNLKRLNTLNAWICYDVPVAYYFQLVCDGIYCYWWTKAHTKQGYPGTHYCERYPQY
ncbi:hypothetical protein PsorP6_015341 [Peronosclerospora sorghi]|uniref:Uncharacterized protein n=1 Tax=Peronosclerospora sorghi TaxID=230839 RepID=A0ACC0VSM9_9STRA|nr:hypothetical protein PsorP6_015341 [Peronosclerospora sorghi]